MKEIKLTQGQVAQVDDADFEWLNQWKWHAAWNKHIKNYYAQRAEHLGYVNGKRKRRSIVIHRVILGLEHGDPRKGDHKEPSETLNNKRSNLRIAPTNSKSIANQGLISTNTSGFKGVSKWSNVPGYRANIRINGKTKYLGTRPTAIEASVLYWAAAQEQFGEFARLA